MSKLKLATAFAELEKLSQEFDGGELDLEAAIPKFKRAAELSKFIKTRLSELDTEIETINHSMRDDE